MPEFRFLDHVPSENESVTIDQKVWTVSSRSVGKINGLSVYLGMEKSDTKLSFGTRLNNAVASLFCKIMFRSIDAAVHWKTAMTGHHVVRVVVEPSRKPSVIAPIRPPAAPSTAEPSPLSTPVPVPPLMDVEGPMTLPGYVDYIDAFVEETINKSFDKLPDDAFQLLQKNAENAEKFLENLAALEPSDLPSGAKEKLESTVKKLSGLVDAHRVLQDLKELEELLKGSQNLGEAIEQGHQNALLARYVRFLIPEDIALEDKLLHHQKWQQYQSARAALEALRQDVVGNREKWTRIRARIFTAAKEATPFLEQKRKITWIHGSRSAAIPVMEEAAKIQAAAQHTLRNRPQPALWPSGMLLQHKIVPLTGELGVGISAKGVNREMLSGMSISGLDTCMSYAHHKEFVFDPDREVAVIKDLLKDIEESNHREDFVGWRQDPIFRLRIAVLRLLLMSQKREQWPSLKSYIKKILQLLPIEKSPSKELEKNWMPYAPLLGEKREISVTTSRVDKDKILPTGQLVCVSQSDGSFKYGLVVKSKRRDIYSEWQYDIVVGKDGEMKSSVYADQLQLPVLQTVPLSSTKLTEDQIEKIRERFLTPTEIVRREVQSTLALFEPRAVKPLWLSKEDLKLVADSFPMVWASCTLEPEYVGQEYLVKGTAALGNDLQLVFTDRDHVEFLRQRIRQYNVQVYSFDVARYIYGQQPRHW